MKILSLYDGPICDKLHIENDLIRKVWHDFTIEKTKEGLSLSCNDSIATIDDRKELIDDTQKGDIVYFDEITDLEIDPLAGDLHNVIANYSKLIDRGVKLFFDRTPKFDSDDFIKLIKKVARKTAIKEDIVFTFLFENLAEVYIDAKNMQIEIMVDTIKISRKKKPGRNKGLDEKSIKAKEMIKKEHILFGGKLNDRELMAKVPVARTKYYVLKKELIEEIGMSTEDVDEAMKRVKV